MPLNRFFKLTMVRPVLLLGLSAFAPLAIYAAFDGYVALDRRQDDLVAQSVASARALVEIIDRQVAAGMEDTQTLAEAPALDPVDGRPADLELFEKVAVRMRDRHGDWLAVNLRAPDGRWIFGASPDSGGGDRKIEDALSFKQAVGTGGPVVGDMVRLAHGQWGIPLYAPVARGGKVVYILTVVLNPQSVRQTLASARLPSPWITAVVNAQGHVVAREPDDERLIGIRVTAEARQARARGGGGGYRGHTAYGVDTQSFYWVSPVTRWSSHVAVPRSVWEAPLRQMLATMVVGFLLCLLVAAALVALWMRDYESRRRQALAVEQATRIDALGRLTGGVAHDFNNLLTVIQGNAEILHRRLKANSQAERPLLAIRTATERAAKLTRQLLVFARGGPAESEPVDLARKVMELIGPMSQLAGPGVFIQTDLEPGLPCVSVDPLQLEAALLNLTANARDAMQGSGRVLISLRRSGDWIVLSLGDQGPGFDPAVLSRVFDPFFTTKPVGQGTGLGLSQVYGLVKGAGGQVQAANVAGGGQVSLYFPPLDAAVEAEPDLTFAPGSSPAASGLESILLVDDNEAVRATTAAYLRERGLSVIEAQDAASALRVLETRAVDAVVSDIIMPGEIDGISLAQSIKGHWPQTPVVLVSGFSERAAEAQAKGFQVINKPYSLLDLERRIQILKEPTAIAET